LQSYLWDNNQAVVQWLTSQLDESDGTIVADSLIGNNIKSVRKDAVINQVKSTINVRMVQLNLNNYLIFKLHSIFVLKLTCIISSLQDTPEVTSDVIMGMFQSLSEMQRLDLIHNLTQATSIGNVKLNS